MFSVEIQIELTECGPRGRDDIYYINGHDMYVA